jgi:hypothetical protein
MKVSKATVARLHAGEFNRSLGIEAAQQRRAARAAGADPFAEARVPRFAPGQVVAREDEPGGVWTVRKLDTNGAYALLVAGEGDDTDPGSRAWVAVTSLRWPAPPQSTPGSHPPGVD